MQSTANVSEFYVVIFDPKLENLGWTAITLPDFKPSAPQPRYAIPEIFCSFAQELPLLPQNEFIASLPYLRNISVESFRTEPEYSDINNCNFNIEGEETLDISLDELATGENRILKVVRT